MKTTTTTNEKTMAKKQYTYKDLLNEAIQFCEQFSIEFYGEEKGIEFEERFIKKANELIATFDKKTAYNEERKNNPDNVKKHKVSPETQSTREEIFEILRNNPQGLTGNEINELIKKPHDDKKTIGIYFNNLIGKLENIEKGKRKVMIINNKGLKQETELTTYTITE